MHFRTVAKTSFDSLRRNRVRTALSLLGIVIGVFSVTLVISLGLAVKAAVVGYVENFTSRSLISVNPAAPGASTGNSMRALMMGASPASLDYADLEALEKPGNLPTAVAVNGTVIGQEFVRRGNREFRSTVVGVSASYPQITPMMKVAQGRFFTREEEKSMAPVVVIGSKIAGKLFGTVDPLGQKVKIKDMSLTVVGVIKPSGNLMGMDIDSVTLMPLRLATKRLTGNDNITEIHVMAADEGSVDETVDGITRLLRRRHRITDPSKDDFMITTSKDIMDRLNTITDVITYLLAFLAAISLLVGGIGIMTIMLVSVTERIREVGLRKALGAKPRDILLQFLAESVVLTTAGGLIGGALGFLVTLGVVAVMRFSGLDVPYVVSMTAFIGAAFISAAVGIVFGISPARKAAKLDPITSLRYE
ncbi:ABC transporter permease [Candidatus Uhrbacteria bacterium]|nr:ABC transporter permease [Candidatus Uhrbacteria bacterium]